VETENKKNSKAKSKKTKNKKKIEAINKNKKAPRKNTAHFDLLDFSI